MQGSGEATAGAAAAVACIPCGTIESYPLWCQKGPEIRDIHKQVHRCRECAARRGAVGQAHSS